MLTTHSCSAMSGYSCVKILPILDVPSCSGSATAGTPYTYHNGLAMFTGLGAADTSQHAALGSLGSLGLHQLPAKGAAHTAAAASAQPFPLLYGEKLKYMIRSSR